MSNNTKNFKVASEEVPDEWARIRDGRNLTKADNENFEFRLFEHSLV
jgi:hypothetical protein